MTTKEEWKKITLGELVTFQRGHDLPKNQRTIGNFPLVSSSGIVDSHNEFKAKGPGVVIGRSGSLGSVHYVEKDYWPLNTTLYSKQIHNCNPKFIYYFLKTLDLENYNVGTSVPTLNRNHIHPLEISVPSIDEQGRIAKTLSDLDTKISNLQNQNHILEQTAQAIFQSWFVDFDGVTEFDNSELGKIPKGWKIKTLDDIKGLKKNSIATGPFGSNLKTSEYVHSGIPVIRGKDIEAGLINENNFVFVTELKANSLAASNVFPEDILITSQGNIGRIGFIPSFTKYLRYVISSNLMKITVNSKIISSIYVYYYLKSQKGQQELLGYASTTGVPHIAQPSKTLKNSKIIIPPQKILEQFDKLISIMIQKNRENNYQLESLTQTRDTLLPKLMSGEIRV